MQVQCNGNIKERLPKIVTQWRLLTPSGDASIAGKFTLPLFKFLIAAGKVHHRLGKNQLDESTAGLRNISFQAVMGRFPMHLTASPSLHHRLFHPS